MNEYGVVMNKINIDSSKIDRLISKMLSKYPDGKVIQRFILPEITPERKIEAILRSAKENSSGRVRV